jgi:predicted Zn-dependent protease
VVICAWFALGARQAHNLSAATAIVTSTHRLTHAQSERAASLLDSAAILNPDRQVKLIRAQLEAEVGNPVTAIALAEQVTRAEPVNPIAWDALARVAGSNATVFENALHEIRVLVPPLPPGH